MRTLQVSDECFRDLLELSRLIDRGADLAGRKLGPMAPCSEEIEAAAVVRVAVNYGLEQCRARVRYFETLAAQEARVA